MEGGYRFNSIYELVLRYQKAKCANCLGNAGNNFDLSRAEVGMTLYLGDTDTNGRVQIYVASVGGDEENYTGLAGAGDYNLDVVAAQVQFAF